MEGLHKNRVDGTEDFFWFVIYFLLVKIYKSSIKTNKTNIVRITVDKSKKKEKNKVSKQKQKIQ